MSTRLKYLLYRNFWIGLDWLFPPECGGCGESGARWCSACQKKVQLIKGFVCLSCGLPQEISELCYRCEHDHPSYTSLRSWSVFEEPVRHAIHRLKYRRDIGLGEALSTQLFSFVHDLGWPVELIVPIPLGKKRYQERGYNQVAMVALPLSMQLGLKYSPNALDRIKETRSQVGLSAAERRENVQDAFKAERNIVGGCRVLLIDDVTTTGATLSSAATALLDSGARVVYAVTIARALPHHSLNDV